MGFVGLAGLAGLVGLVGDECVWIMWGGKVGWTAWILGRICMTCEGMGWMWVDLWGL